MYYYVHICTYICTYFTLKCDFTALFIQLNKYNLTKKKCPVTTKVAHLSERRMSQYPVLTAQSLLRAHSCSKTIIRMPTLPWNTRSISYYPRNAQRSKLLNSKCSLSPLI